MNLIDKLVMVGKEKTERALVQTFPCTLVISEGSKVLLILFGGARVWFHVLVTFSINYLTA